MYIGEKHGNLRRFAAVALLAAISSAAPAANDQTNDQPLTEKWGRFPCFWGHHSPDPYSLQRTAIGRLANRNADQEPASPPLLVG